MARSVLVLIALAIVAGASASSSAARARWFHSPSKNISCELGVSRPLLGTYAFCATLHPPRCVTLKANGQTRAPQNCLLGNEPENTFTLRYGRSVRLGPFRCTSRRAGMRCVIVRSGHGFLISRERLKRF
jgi:hypothetical protein